VMQAMEAVLKQGTLTPDLGGKASTGEVTAAVCEKIRKLS